MTLLLKTRFPERIALLLEIMFLLVLLVDFSFVVVPVFFVRTSTNGYEPLKGCGYEL